MSNDGVLRLLDEAVRASASAKPTLPGRYGIWVYARDHHDAPPSNYRVARAKKAIGQDAGEFEFGNRFVDEYITIVSNLPALETWVREHEEDAHLLAAIEDESHYVGGILYVDSLEQLKQMLKQVYVDFGGDPELFESNSVAKPDDLKAIMQGVSLGKDDKGFYVYTHRARTKSYKTPHAIPKSKIAFIETTG